jgi:hypothetical protein
MSEALWRATIVSLADWLADRWIVAHGPTVEEIAEVAEG